jgi:CubicO group peptidase (beta-lactamase class C family)
VERGVLSLETQTMALLVDRSGRPWAGNMGEIRLRHLLSFTAGISSDVPASEDATITLDEAVLRIYEDQAPTASPPGSYFYYGGSTHLRIAARMAERATGLSWRQLYDEQLRVPLGWSTASTYFGGANPNPAGGLVCTGLEYTRFLMMQLRLGLDGSTRLLDAASIAAQRADAFGPSTAIAYSAYSFLGRTYHYGFGNWLETANGQAPGATNPVNRWSSTGKFGWAPWIAADSGYAAVIMTRQADLPTSFVPSENLKAALDPLIRTALASNPRVIRTVP